MHQAPKERLMEMTTNDERVLLCKDFKMLEILLYFSLHITFFLPSPWLGIRKQPNYSMAGSHHGKFWFPLCCAFKQKQEQALTAPFPSIHQTGTHRCFITHLLLALMRQRTCIERRGGLRQNTRVIVIVPIPNSVSSC